MHSHTAVVLALAALLSACASPRFDTAGVDMQLTPRAAAADSAQGTEVVWGGLIVASRNLSDATELEVLGYPLDREQRPQIDKPAQGRFLAIQSGYLEPADYANGRAITVKGRVEATRRGKIGEAGYTYPVVEAAQIELWPQEPVRAWGGSRVNFGIGIGIGF